MLHSLIITPSTQSRSELLEWLNSALPVEAPNGKKVPIFNKVEQCGSGVPYVLLLPVMLPVSHPPLLSSKVKVPAAHDFEAVSNLKMMQDALHRNGIVQPAVLVSEAQKLIKGNFQANLQLLQWFRGLYTALQDCGIEGGQGRVILEPHTPSDSLDGTIAAPPVAVIRADDRRRSNSRANEASPDAVAAAAHAILAESRDVNAEHLKNRQSTPPQELTMEHGQQHQPPQERPSAKSTQVSTSKASLLKSGVRSTTPRSIHRASTAPTATTPKSKRTPRPSSSGERPTTPVRRGTPSRRSSAMPSSVYRANVTYKNPPANLFSSGSQRRPPATAVTSMNTSSDGIVASRSGVVTTTTAGARPALTPRSNGPRKSPLKSGVKGAARPSSPNPVPPSGAGRAVAEAPLHPQTTNEAASISHQQKSSASRAPSSVPGENRSTPALVPGKSKSAAAAVAEPTFPADHDDDAVLRVATERQFYYDKLRMIERIVCGVLDAQKRRSNGNDRSPTEASEAVLLAQSIREVLYDTS